MAAARPTVLYFTKPCFTAPTTTHPKPDDSDNGLSDAQRFFVRLRPLEGRMKGGAASKTTASGARFDSVLAKRSARL